MRAYLGLAPFGLGHFRQAVHALTELALQTDKGVVLAGHAVDRLRRSRVIVPTFDVIERICRALTDSLSDTHRDRLDGLLKRKGVCKLTWLAWLRQSPAKPNSRHMLEHIDRLKALQALDLPPGTERLVHQNRLLKIAREGAQMTAADLAKCEPQRRYATLVALVVEGMATVTDEIIDLHDRIVGRLFAAAKHKHHQQFQASGKSINDKVRLYGRIGQALLEAKRSGTDPDPDPYAAIESMLPWDDFSASVADDSRGAEACAAGGFRLPVSPRRELCDLATLHEETLGESGDHGGRHRPALLRANAR